MLVGSTVQALVCFKQKTGNVVLFSRGQGVVKKKHIVESCRRSSGAPALEDGVLDHSSNSLWVFRPNGPDQSLHQRIIHDARNLLDFGQRNAASVAQARGRSQIRDGFPQVAARDGQNVIEHQIQRKRDVFSLHDIAQAQQGVFAVQQAEAELGAPQRQRVDDARDVVANQAETRHARVVFHGAPQRRLRIVGHGVGLVQDDDLVRRTRVLAQVLGRRVRHREPGKVFDLSAHYQNASFVRRVELKHPQTVQPRAVESFGKRQHRGCFAGSRRAVEEHVWQVGQSEGFSEHANGVVSRRHVVEFLGAVLFDPRRVVESFSVVRQHDGNKKVCF
ncbi:hypothetical protein CLUG_05715 [Clavispora lusitaniae ATCC 42720]|uniref:Uncharacterized protein n=1 Tax=Clavispora lusitaniae (strain ATCC 42720) TaxID=306902 RepID=C4YBY7_CLAL4|nr:uncharacterized protein CLUG_05715 [Clavispora lusitaniae ATCC 42720]EEQ41586.1 hypothetical protein CLUG_05715 [Clavispora lusitaniae ATCC 42720]